MGSPPATAYLTETAVFACGCFWSKEYFFSRARGVLATRVGYTGGGVAHPTYNAVLTKTTGHAEAVEVQFDPTQTSFEELTRLFFTLHDPTIDRRSGGGQYRSAIFYTSDNQRLTAEAIVAEWQSQGHPIATVLEPAGTFWPAEDRHQQYCDRHQITPRQYTKATH